MDTQALRAFIAVVETGSFSAAAEQLHLTQPAVTKRIQGLENQVGAALFDRFQRRIVLTEAGRVLLPHAQTVLQQLSRAELEIQNLSGKVGGTLALATSHHIGLHRLPVVLRQYSRSYPDVDLQLQFMESEKAYESVLAGEVELAFATLSPEAPASIDSLPIWQDTLAFVAAPGHPLGNLCHPGLEDLADYNAILPAPFTHTYRIVKQLFTEREIPLKAVMPTNYLETIKMMVSVGMGWSVLPESMLDESLCALPLETVPLRRSLGVIRHRNRILSNAAQAIIQQALQSTEPPSETAQLAVL